MILTHSLTSSAFSENTILVGQASSLPGKQEACSTFLIARLA
jgi:hypothetical protein